MEFFIPYAKDAEQQTEVYEGIRKFVSESMGADLSPRRIFSLTYRHEGKNYHAEVGQTHSLNGEPVIAILYEQMRDLYYVCTPNRGVLGDIPILAGAWCVERSVDFAKGV
jgi:hypothetical protein